MAPKRQKNNSPRLAPLKLAFCLALLLAAFCFLPRVSDHPTLIASFLGTTAALLIFLYFVRRQAIRDGRALTYDIVPKRVHYVQLMMHSSIYVYWGWYWPEVYHDVALIAAQIVFAYVVDMLICWSRRDHWILGFGPFPIVLSANLFLWFKDDWFYLQFLLIAVGLLAKEFIKWKRDGRLTHIFNPSAFPLFLFSLALIATRSTGMTWGIEISSTMHRPPYIYFEIFLLGLIVEALFQVTLITLSSAATLFVVNVLYTKWTGDYQFVDSNIPVAVFLGLHLLVTDPATSPRTSLGKIIFGTMYGAGVFGLYTLLKLINAPEFYDKLLCVPPLNLTVPALDRVSEALTARFRWLAPALSWSPRKANLAWMGVWIALFATMTGTGFMVKGKDHPGGSPAYWKRACEQGRVVACNTWVRTLKSACEDNSVPDCLTLGTLMDEGHYVTRDARTAGVSFGRACDLGSSAACASLLDFMRRGGKVVFLKACGEGSGASCFILGSLFSGGSGVPQDAGLAFDLFTKSCDYGWPRGCGRLGVSYLVGQGTQVNPFKARDNLDKGCQGDNAASCYQAADLYASGKLGFRNLPMAGERLKQACGLGLPAACAQEKRLGLQDANLKP